MCEGQTTQLCAPEGVGYTYKWDTGSTARCITVNGQGTYHVTVTDANGCRSYCSQVVTVVPRPSCNISGNSTICEGGSTELCAPEVSGYTYLWSTGATSRCVTVSVAGTYYVTVTNSNGCSKVCSKSVTVRQAPFCSITGELNPEPGENTTLCAPYGYGYSYLWNTGATTKCVTVNTEGTYSVTITNSSGCTSSCSVDVTYDLGRNAAGEDITPVVDGTFAVKAYPNPFSSRAIIEFQNIQSNSYVVIEIYSLTGNKVATLFDGDVEKGVLYKTELNAENLLAGVYVYRILSGDQIISGKLLLIR
jgi:hypothetical protein